ncbi:MAG: prolyl oligopeptidase family serine peptidase [Candidatus Bathyarchaeota archaeon]|nr:prolyl oligopeptidase family serine peptidase [Candidatus Bathyarchaeota archaeon]
MKQTEHQFEKRIEKSVSLEYLLYLPPNYQPKGMWPLVLFLHGMGQRGDDLNLIKKHGIPKIVEKQDYPFVAVSPQCPSESRWTMELDALHALIVDVVKSYAIDRSRIYLTGLSLGGFGAWHLAEAYPHLFAAIIPICGGTRLMIGFPERIKVLKDTPIWAFHGAKDDVVPLKNSQDLVDVLIQHGGNIKFTIYPDAGHDSWTRTYENPDVIAWLMTQKRQLG